MVQRWSSRKSYGSSTSGESSTQSSELPAAQSSGGNGAESGKSEEDDLDINEMTPYHIREAIIEEARKTKSIRGILLEAINVLYREYDVRGFKYFRMRVEDAKTMEELKIAADMLATIGRFHEVMARDDTEK